MRKGGPARHLHHGQDEMETFFQEAAKISDFAPNEKLYRACEMEIVGPALPLG